jgi:hypothetical protein
MLAFTLSIVLFLMILPAFLSVIFVTSSLTLLAWNMSWYAVMGLFGALALKTPWGWGFGLIPAAIYIKRYLAVRRSGKSTVTFSHYRMKARAAGPGGESQRFTSRGASAVSSVGSAKSSDNDSVVIEAEFTKDP